MSIASVINGLDGAHRTNCCMYIAAAVGVENIDSTVLLLNQFNGYFNLSGSEVTTLYNNLDG